MDIAEYISTSSSYTTFLLASVITFLLVSYMSRKPWQPLPPGPLALPIIGSWEFLVSSDPRQSVLRLWRRYGDIFTLCMGYETVVFVNGYQLVTEMLIGNQGKVEDRPDVYFMNSIGKKIGDYGSITGPNQT